MSLLQFLFRFYIKSSLHVAFSCLSLLLMTQQELALSSDPYMAGFVFFSTVVGYNFVKYERAFHHSRRNLRKELKAIIACTIFMVVGMIYSFFQFQMKTQLGALFIVGSTLLYALPFFPNTQNARNWKGVKIYIVALCWTLATVLLPLLEQNHSFDALVFAYSLQRFLLVFVLILIFEIVDLKNDDPLLQTVPQQIGVEPTKKLGFGLLFLFLALDFLNGNFSLPSLFFILVTAFFLAFANENRSPYYTLFWAEAIPVFWWSALLLLQ